MSHRNTIQCFHTAKIEFLLNSRAEEEGAKEKKGYNKCLVPTELFGKMTKQQLHMPHINYV